MNQSMTEGARSGPDEDTRLLLASETDPQAFGDLYERNSLRILGFFYRRTLCVHTSGELAAETFAQAWESRTRFSDADGGSAVAWLYGIATNLHREWMRRSVVADAARKRLGIETPLITEDDLEHVVALVDLSAVAEGLREAIDRMSPKLRSALLLRVAMDLPYEDVADRLGCTVGAARVRVSRAIDRLTGEVQAR